MTIKHCIIIILLFCGFRRVRLLANDIRRKYRKDPQLTGPVTFREFVQYIIDRRTPRPLNRHWQPYWQLCQPCRIHFDFIGHYETLGQDSRYVLRQLGINETFSQLQPSSGARNSSYRVASLFSQLTELEIQRLVHVYRHDFDLFGNSANISQLGITPAVN